jgi:hypothetical protein
MNDDLMKQVSRQDYDLSRFASTAIEDVEMRELFIHMMLTDPHIMVYDHCFSIIKKACEESPQLFYPHWQEFVSLLSHSNSYHRYFGLILISLLAGVDTNNYLDSILPNFLSHTRDKKFMTAACCVKSCYRIIQARPDLGKVILDSLFEQDASTPYSESQADLIKADILAVVEVVHPDNLPDEKIAHWIVAASTCSSPKSRRAAKDLMQKYSLTG